MLTLEIMASQKKGMKFWTTSEIEELEILYRRGYTLNDIGATLDRGNKVTIHAALKRFGIYEKCGYRKKRPWTVREKLLLKEYYKVGHSIAEMARRLMRPDNSVSYMINRMGLTAEKRYYWTGTDKAMLIHWYGDGLTYKEIAEKLDRSFHAVKGMIQRMGLADKRYAPRNKDKIKVYL